MALTRWARSIPAILSVLGSAGCSLLVPHDNAGIGVLERGAPSPVRSASVGAKYVGWSASAPLVVAMAPVAALAWATPWVDLSTAVDIATAPAIAVGYATEAAVGFPAYGALAWWPEDGRAPRTRALDLGEGMRSRWEGALPLWGMIAEHREAMRPARTPEPLPADVGAYYEVPGDALARLRQALADAERDAPGAFEVRLEGERNAASLEVTLADGPGSRPLVLMSPPTQGIFAARWLARRYARLGAHAAVIVPDEVFLEPDLAPRRLEEKMREAVVQARAVTRVLASRADVGPIRYLGISAGGIFGVVLMAVEPRIDRGVLIFPGGRIPDLVVDSTESTVVAYREAWAARGKSAGEISREVASVIRSEPVDLARFIDPRRTLLFLSRGDTRVPIAGGLAVERALGHPETWVLAGDHQTAGICFGFVLRESDAFLLPPAP